MSTPAKTVIPQATQFVCRTDPRSTGAGKPITPEQNFAPLDLRSVLGERLALSVPRLSLLPRSASTLLRLLEGNVPQPLSLRLRIIYAANDAGLTDGKPAPSRATLAPIFAALVDGMRQDWSQSGIDFVFLPDCDFEVRNDTRLCNDFALPAELAAKFPAADSAFTSAQISGFKSQYSTNAHRNQVAAERPNTLLWIIAEPNELSRIKQGTLKDPHTGKEVDVYQWVHQPHVSGSWSGGSVDFVILNKYDFAQSAEHSHHDASRAAHETGHFLHLPHTHWDDKCDESSVTATPVPSELQARVARWTGALEKWIDAQVSAHSTPAQAQVAFDRDRDCGVNDTPADPSAGLMGLVNLAAGNGNDSLGPISSITLHPTHVSGPLVLTPNRNTPMGYYLDGTTDAPMQFSPGQVSVMRGALLNDNRRRLVAAQLGDTVEAHVRQCAVWSPNPKGQGYSWGLSLDALKSKHAEMTAKSLHLSSQCAYVVNGAVLYDAVWDEGARQQRVLWGWAEADVRQEVQVQVQAGLHVSSIQAYRHPGTGLRYNVLFEPGTGAQVVVLNKTQAELKATWDSYMPTGMRFRHLDAAVDEHGVVRHAAVLISSPHPQHYVTGYTLADIDADYGTQWQAGRKLTSLCVVWTAEGPRYTGVWDPDTAGQLVMWLHVRERIRELYDQMWCQGYKLRSLSTVAL